MHHRQAVGRATENMLGVIAVTVERLAISRHTGIDQHAKITKGKLKQGIERGEQFLLVLPLLAQQHRQYAAQIFAIAGDIEIGTGTNDITLCTELRPAAPMHGDTAGKAGGKMVAKLLRTFGVSHEGAQMHKSLQLRTNTW